MADLKISALPASTTPLAGTEILPIVQSATTRQVSVANLTAGRAVSALSLTSTNDATINGITVGRGGGSVSLNTAVGASALAATSTGDSNAAFGASALASNLAGTGNTATGFTSLRDNTSGNYNVASGYLALATNLSGANNVGIGYSVLSTGTATSNNTAIGYEALKVTSGSTNTAIGYQSGIAMTTGTKNVILGSYSGNTGTLDIRISNNNIVLSDGDGNVRAWWDNANARFYGTLLATGITNSALTSGRVTYAGTSGVLQDNANFVFDGNNVGIGIAATANSPLAVQANTGNTAIRLVGTSFSGTSNAGIYWYDSNNSTFNGYIGNFSTSFDFYNQRNTPIIFSANGAEKLRITGSTNYIYTASGVNVGIGTSSPVSALDVRSANATMGNYQTIQAFTTNTATIDFGGGISLGGNYSGSSTIAQFASIAGRKENGTDGNYAGYLQFGTASQATGVREVMRLDSAGNLGLGVTPSAWSVGKAIEIGNVGNAVWCVSATQITMPQNAYFDGSWKYGANGLATRYAQEAGVHQWWNAASGSAGGAVTFTQAMTLNASGGLQVLNTVGVGNTAPSTSGAGITFPATQSASSNANTLDDYEEGTWTATFTTDGGSVTTSASIRYGFYTKIGNQVTVTCQVTATAISSPTGGLYVVTLPFPSSSTTGTQSSVSVSGDNFGALAATALVGNIPANSSYIQINSYNAGAQALMATNLNATSTVTITATYFV